MTPEHSYLTTSRGTNLPAEGDREGSWVLNNNWPMEFLSLRRYQPSHFVLYYIRNTFSLLYKPFWFEFPVTCSQRQADKCESRIKPPFICPKFMFLSDNLLHWRQCSFRHGAVTGKEEVYLKERRKCIFWVWRDKMPNSIQSGVDSCKICNTLHMI